METLEIIVSKANSIPFIIVDGLLPSFDNTLSCDVKMLSIPAMGYEHPIFIGQSFLIQIKAGLTATVILTRITDAGIESVVGVTTVTTYSTFKIYEYLITNPGTSISYFNASSEASLWISEWVDVFTNPNDGTYKLAEWTNQDLINDNYEFDYNTVLAIANVNFMNIIADINNYEPLVNRIDYNNQDEETVIKSNLFRRLKFQPDPLPHHVAEKLVIGLQHDTVQINNVGYTVPEVEMEDFGSGSEISATIKLKTSLGLNTHDIGFDCDSTTTGMIEPKEIEGATGSGQFTVSEGYIISWAVAQKVSGTPLLKIGTTPGGGDILPEEEIINTTPPQSLNLVYTPVFTKTSYTIYYTLSGGVLNLAITTAPFRQQ